jgi:hypothetical protein
MTDRLDRAASERAMARIRATASTVRAPQSLRAAVAQERLAVEQAAPRRPRGLIVAGAAASAAVALALVVVVLVSGSNGTPGGSVADAAQVALRAPTDGPPARTSDGHLRMSVGGITFPDYGARWKRWRAVGTRTDTVAGRAAVTVVFARGAERVGYTIVDGDPLSVPTDAPRIAYDGLDVAVLRRGDARYITWEKDGHTCVLATRGTDLKRLLSFAAND